MNLYRNDIFSFRFAISPKALFKARPIEERVPSSSQMIKTAAQGHIDSATSGVMDDAVDRFLWTSILGEIHASVKEGLHSFDKHPRSSSVVGSFKGGLFSPQNSAKTEGVSLSKLNYIA